MAGGRHGGGKYGHVHLEAIRVCATQIKPIHDEIFYEKYNMVYLINCMNIFITIYLYIFLSFVFVQYIEKEI